MGRLVRTLALAAVLTHMTLGCCLHHASAQTAVGSGASACAAGGCAHERRGGGDCDRPDEQSPSHKCCDHQRCSFVPPKSAGGLDVLIERQLLSLATFLPETTGATSPNRVDLVDPTGAGCPEPVRLHLLHQVLLI